MNAEDVHRLWDTLSDYDASQSHKAVVHLMTQLCDVVGAWNATWAGAVKVNADGGEDPLQGWRVAAMEALHPIDPQPDDGHFREILKSWDRREIDPSFLLPLRSVGHFRTYSLRRELPGEWFDSPFYMQHYGRVGTHDAVFVAFPLNDDCESHFGFYSRETFTDEAIELLVRVLRGIKWFHRDLLMSHGLLMASAPLTPTERRVMHLLLTGVQEREIALQLGMAPSTTH